MCVFVCVGGGGGGGGCFAHLVSLPFFISFSIHKLSWIAGKSRLGKALVHFNC